MENECEALPGVAYPGVLDNRSTINTKTGYDDDDDCRCNICCKLTTQILNNYNIHTKPHFFTTKPNQTHSEPNPSFFKETEPK